MFSRISGLFKREEEPSKIDIKDLLIQIRLLSPEEKQLIRNTLDEPVVDKMEVCSDEKSIVKSESESESESISVSVSEPQNKVVTTEAVPSYEYTESKYKRRQD
jgi:hypothetical protein